MNNKKLLENINSSGLKYRFIAEQMGISYYTLNKKIRSMTEFKASEISILCKLLNISDPEEIKTIFFS